jgi:hypothetical protein
LFGRAVQNFALNSNEPVKGVQSEALFGRAKFRTPTNPSKVKGVQSEALFGPAKFRTPTNPSKVKGVQSEALFGRAKFRTPTNPSKEFKAKLCLAVQSFALNSNEPVKIGFAGRSKSLYHFRHELKLMALRLRPLKGTTHELV